MDKWRDIADGYSAADHREYEPYGDAGDDAGIDAPLAPVGQDERRMQVRAYNFWASLLGDRRLPQVAALKARAAPDFADHAVLLHFDQGIENPAIAGIGAALARECDSEGPIHRLSDVPGRSLLSRITDHYMQILANLAPIGFEAEFVNRQGRTILYRGILLPFSDDDETIDHIYGVINWKEVADQHTTDALIDEVGEALARSPRQPLMPISDWADGPAALPVGGADERGGIDLPAPAFAAEPDDGAMGLADWLASAREFAEAARTSEDRSRSALYAALGRAWDFALAARAAPEAYAELLDDAGLTRQDRAPMTPLAKLVFGADYDKTRLAEYAAALLHAERLGIERGAFGRYLADAPGGLKGVVQAERKLRRGETRRPAPPRGIARLAAKLRELPERPVEMLAIEGEEFALVMLRRLPGGRLALLGEVSDDVALVERAARRLIG